MTLPTKDNAPAENWLKRNLTWKHAAYLLCYLSLLPVFLSVLSGTPNPRLIMLWLLLFSFLLYLTKRGYYKGAFFLTITPVVFIGLFIALIAGFGYDHREKIAMAIIFSNDDLSRQFPSWQASDDKVFSSALLTRFPVNSPSSNLQAFIRLLGGQCTKQKSGNLFCNLPEIGVFCYATSIHIDVQLSNENIVNIKTERHGVGC